MKIRELHQVDCIEIAINGSGDYFFPLPSFKDKKIDSIFMWDGAEDMSNTNLFVSIYSSDRKPLYVNCPAVKFGFDNINNRIDKVLDFDLLKVTYTGSNTFTLYVYFSTEEKIIDLQSYQVPLLNAKNLRLDLERIIYEEQMQGDKWVSLLSADNADYMRGKKVRFISCKVSQKYLISLQFTNGKSLNKIPFCFLQQTPVLPYTNVMPFVVDGVIDLDLTYMEILQPFNPQRLYIDLTMYYQQ